jgi:hypothetical protein
MGYGNVTESTEVGGGESSAAAYHRMTNSNIAEIEDSHDHLIRTSTISFKSTTLVPEQWAYKV